MKAQTYSGAVNSDLGYLELMKAWFITAIINTVIFTLCTHHIAKTRTALMLALVFIFLVAMLAVYIAFKPAAAKRWQYMFSQLIFSGVIFSAFGTYFIGWIFFPGVMIFSLVTLGVFYFNLSEAKIRQAHASYITVHVLTGMVVVLLWYLKY